MYTIKPLNKFQKDVKRAEKRGYDIDHLKEVIKMLAAGTPLPERYKDHALTGNWAGHRD